MDTAKAHRARRKFTHPGGKRPACLLALPLLAAGVLPALFSAEKKGDAVIASVPRDDAPFFTAPGFTHPGKPIISGGAADGRLHIVVRDAATGKPTPCRINVVGADGNFHQPPADDRMASLALVRRGNRHDTGPYRYLGYFFYSTGEITVAVPPGAARVEVWKGLEFRPEVATLTIEPRAVAAAAITLRRTVPMADLGYYAGDMHFHLPRTSDADDALILDLLEAEDVRYGALLASNHPPGTYHGVIEKLLGTRGAPQFQGLGRKSVRARGDYTIMSGQEYRNGPFGHLGLYWRDDLVLAGRSFNSDHWPVYGLVGRETQLQGGFAIHEHGGYKNEVYADVALGSVNAVELLQFGTYRGIGLRDWYNILNTGYRLPCLGGSDFPLNRRMADCITYARVPPATGAGPRKPGINEWLRAAVAGQSFMTNAPLLLLDVDGHEPGSILRRTGGQRLQARIRVRCEVAPVTHVDLIVNGQTVTRFYVPGSAQQGQWIEFSHSLALTAPSWIAARAWSQANFGSLPTGMDDYTDSAAEAHTNPVYCYINGKAPYSSIALDAWVSRIDVQFAAHERRSYPEKSKVIAYYQRARDVLTRIRGEGGLSSDANIRQLAGELPPPTPGSSPSAPGFVPPTRTSITDPP